MAGGDDQKKAPSGKETSADTEGVGTGETNGDTMAQSFLQTRVFHFYKLPTPKLLRYDNYEQHRNELLVWIEFCGSNLEEKADQVAFSLSLPKRIAYTRKGVQ